MPLWLLLPALGLAGWQTFRCVGWAIRHLTSLLNRRKRSWIAPSPNERRALRDFGRRWQRWITSDATWYHPHAESSSLAEVVALRRVGDPDAPDEPADPWGGAA